MGFLRSKFASVIVAVVAVVALAAIVITLTGGGKTKTVTALFPRALAVYKGSSVRVLGVAVGKVVSVRPEGTQVRVVMKYDAARKIPSTATAAIVPPSIVSDRYVQLVPAYTGGAVMADRAVIDLDHTETPVELDNIFKSIDDLDKALGPEGANAHGALSDLVSVGAQNLQGNGAAFNTTLHQVSLLVETLANNRGDLFATIDALQKFTSTLAADDGGVRRLNDDLAAVSVQLNGERDDLAAALKNLAAALGQVQLFVQNNATSLTTDIHQLTGITNGLVSEKQAIQEVLNEAPLALHNLALAFDPGTQTLRTRSANAQLATGGLPSPSTLCVLITLTGQPCPVGAAAQSSAPRVSPSLSSALAADQALQSLLAVKP